MQQTLESASGENNCETTNKEESFMFMAYDDGTQRSTRQGWKEKISKRVWSPFLNLLKGSAIKERKTEEGRAERKNQSEEKYKPLFTFNHSPSTTSLKLLSVKYFCMYAILVHMLSL